MIGSICSKHSHRCNIRAEKPLCTAIVQQPSFFCKRVLDRMRKNWRDFRKELEKFVKKDCNNSRDR